MFDKLIESNSVQAEFKPRRKFFMVSTVVVGIMFLSAVVISLYAQNIDLGTDSFELVEMIAPVAADAPEPEPPRQQLRQNDQQETSELPNRQQLIPTIDQTTKVPDKISTDPFRDFTIPKGEFTNNPNQPNSNGSGTPGSSGSESSSPSEVVATEPAETKVPPPVAKEPVKPPRMISDGVINGKAKYLPSPAYPAPAKLVGAYGVVNVQVTIDEEGNVISSKAVSGHPLLRATAEAAAWKARFSPTYLSRVPVKVTGVIAFNFKRS